MLIVRLPLRLSQASEFEFDLRQGAVDLSKARRVDGRLPGADGAAAVAAGQLPPV